MSNINANRFLNFRDNGGAVYKNSINNLICDAVDMHLPNILNWHSVAVLWACDGSSDRPSVREVDIYFKDIINGFKSGGLALVPENEDQNKPVELVMICGEIFTSEVIKQGVERKAFIDWLKSIDRWPIHDCLLMSWFVDLPDEQSIQEVAVCHSSKNNLVVKEPQSKDDWCNFMIASCQLYFSIYEQKPTYSELWVYILSNPIQGCKFEETKNTQRQRALKTGNLLLSYPRFQSRYKAYFV